METKIGRKLLICLAIIFSTYLTISIYAIFLVSSEIQTAYVVIIAGFVIIDFAGITLIKTVSKLVRVVTAAGTEISRGNSVIGMPFEGKPSQIKSKLGPEAIAIAQGTGRHHFHHTVRFANVLGTPNWMEPGTAQCFFPRVKTGEVTYGCLPVCDYYGDVNPACVLIWGHNPIVCGADCESQFRIQECLRKGTKLIVIDPRKSETAEKAEIWLQPRPGTDDALALSILNVIINEGLYDRVFVEKWTVGFESLKERVRQHTPEWAEKITWVPAEKIREAARLFATTKPATLEWGVALEQTPNCFQTVRAVSLLPGLTGNFDIPGGWIEGMHLLPDPDTLQERISPEMKAKRLGSDRFQLLAGVDQGMPSAHIPSVLRAMRTGEPYQVRALMCFGNNGLLGFGDTKDVYETLMGLDFILVMDLYMTPTAELADIVLPAARWLELDQLFGVPSLADHVVLAQQKIISCGNAGLMKKSSFNLPSG